MTSNALSKRRGPLRRPKICHASHNPGRCDPPLPPRTCSLSPVEFEINIGDVESLDLSACCEALPEGEELTVDISAAHGSVGSPDQDATNCDSTANYQYETPDYEVIDVITAVVTWSDGGQCTAISTATVVEEEE